jgi:hypothetical protein
MTCPIIDGHSQKQNDLLQINNGQPSKFFCMFFFIAQRPTVPFSVYPSPESADDQKRQKRKTKLSTIKETI